MSDIQTIIATLQEYVRSGELDRQFQTDKRLRREKNRGALNDIRQEFLAQFLRRLYASQFHDIYRDEVYIVRSVKHFITDHCRSRQSKRNIKQQRLLSYRGDSDEVIDYARQRGNCFTARAEQTADEEAVIRDAHMTILRVAGAMPEKRRRVLILALRGEPTATIAQTLGVTESTITNHLSTAFQDVVEALQKDGHLTPSKREPHNDNT